MNRVYCERESAIIEALRRGDLDAELEKHAATCAICADTLAVSQFLQADKNKIYAPTQDPDFLWWKARLASKRLAVERATRSIALVRAISYLGVTAAGLWLVFTPGHLGLIMDAVSKNRIWPAGVLSQSAVFLGVGTLVFALLGSLYLVRSEK